MDVIHNMKRLEENIFWVGVVGKNEGNRDL